MPLNPAWKRAFKTATDFSLEPRKIEELENDGADIDAATRRRAHRLVLGWLRERGRVSEALKPMLRKRPRPALQTLLELAGTEIILSPADRIPAIVHHAVESTKRLLSKREAGLVNAVLRRLPEALKSIGPEASHPGWLVARWKRALGDDATERLLRWNQEEAPLYVRWASEDPLPEGTHPTAWPGFHKLDPGALGAVLPMVQAGRAYIQDPFTAHPVALALAHHPGTVIDLCAAPGGKSRALLDQRAEIKKLVAVDLPGARLERLRENLADGLNSGRAAILGCDLTSLTPAKLEAAGHPPLYDAVVLDVPCSNTGVIGRRPDVRWLLSERQIAALVEVQSRLLEAAAALVAPGGRLVYSTCSLEPEENEDQIAAFCARHPEFEAGPPKLSRPWVDGHDGGGAFPLTRCSATK